MIKKLLFIIFLAFSSTYAQTTTVPTYVPKDGLLAYFPFNGNANDASGSGSDGNPTDVTLTTDRFGVANTAYSFNGISSNINALITNIPQNNSPRTISGWFKTNDAFTSPDKYEICIFNYGILAKTQRLSLSVYSKGYLNVVNGPVFSDGSFYVNNFDYSNNDWYFYTLTYDGTKASLFINGEFVSENLISLNTTGNTFKIGQRIPGDTTDESFKGKIDDIGIWNRVLTPTEINALYESGDTSSFYTLIPDANFEKKLIALGLDSGPINGKVMTANISSITSLDVSASQISDLTGIESFAALQVLNCRANYLTNLNISKNNALTYLNCSSNRLTNLDISSNINLKTLSCDNNQLTSLDASSNIALTTLYCSSNSALTNLNVSKNTALTYLKCNANKLTSLNVSNNTALTNLNCSDNKLTNLDVEKNVSLNILYVAVNQLTNLNLSNNVNLTELYCGVNQLTNLDLSKNIALTNFDCSENLLLASLNLKNGKNTLLKSSNLGFIYNPQLTCIQVDDVAYSDANWSSKKDAKATFSTACSPKYILLPDNNFEQKLIDLGIDTDGLNGKISNSNISTITSLNLSNSNISDLAGIENFTSLTDLDCSNNQLTTLNLNQNLLLETLNASSNQITTLDLSKNTNLKIIYIANNPLVSLNIRNGNNTKLIVPSKAGKRTAISTSFLGLNKLGCIQVDDEEYSNANWSNIKEPTTIYSNTCKTLGLEESIFDKVVIYPNPTKGELHINNILLNKATVYDALGKLIKTTTFSTGNNDNIIHLAGLPKGIYYVYLESEGTNTAKKVIVE
ncbi:LamG-like jellyroll fold domain-containing protein [Flavobacterium sp. PS2]|uniref:LamG-like jellyroll fold domain-containing protein n=1 Tax=Flavobacterium sp. PS2 TaxID=3384157 RepID=UPI00390CC188